MNMARNEPWAQLVCSTDMDSEPILIYKDRFVIGRGKGSDLCLSGNKLVSGSHCYIQKDADGSVKLYDSSTNGTLLNQKTKLTNGVGAAISHGDEFHVVFKKGSEEAKLAYVFQDIEALQEETLDHTQSYSDIEQTLEDTSTLSDQLVSNDDPVPAKRRKLETHTSQVPGTSKVDDVHVKRVEAEKGDEAIANTVSAPGDVREGEDTKESVEGEGKPDEAEPKKKKQLPPKDDFEETLMCMICQDILHDCISLQPCMHSFCSGCYSDWMERSSECPSCRLKVERINKNHIVNNLVDAYLKNHPDKKRSEEDLKELDQKNKITRDMLYPKRGRRREYDESSDDSFSDSDSGSLVEITLPNVASTGLLRFGPLMVSSPHNRATFGPPRTVCRQCPNYNAQIAATTPPTIPAPGTNPPTQPNAPQPNTNINTNPSGSQTTESTATTTNAAPTPGTSGDIQPTTSTAAATPNPPVFVCGPRQNHIMCQCCYSPMPDRRHEVTTLPDLPRTSCCICWRNFCHLYWGCRKPGCSGCIGKFKDMTFSERDLNRVLIDNEHETIILKEYLQSKSKTFKDLLTECSTKLDSKEFSCMDQVRGLRDSNSVICYTCGLKNFKEMVYQYRKNIPNSELPESAKSRGDCYWGKNCRTAKNKPHHAKNFNHICEQTRFT